VQRAIEAADLTRRYGRSVGVQSIDLAVRTGECFGFLGPNGSGKTTFIRLVLGLIRPTSGSARVMGHDIGAERMAALGQVGYLPGDLGLYPSLTGRRILDALARLHPRPPSLREELLDALRLDGADLRRRVREYSRGMRQKLGLVAALQHDPPVAILDEPTSGLDPVVTGRVLEWLAARSRAGRTIFFSSHVLAEVEELCDRVAMVRRGRLLRVGPVSELVGERRREVEVRFAVPVDPSRYAVPGLGRVDVEGRRHRLTLAGDPRALLAALGALPVEDLSIERPRLEDAFRDLYSDDGEEPGR
jgi:ABC-2 type transport system ATP-binding protein